MDVSPRISPVGSDQRGWIRGRFSERKPLEESEQECQQSVPRPQSLVDVHPGAKLYAFPTTSYWELSDAAS